MLKDFHVDLFVPQVKAQSRQKLFQVLAELLSDSSGTSAESLNQVFEKRLTECSFGIENRIAIFDARSVRIRKPVLAVMTLEKPTDFGAPDGVPADILACVISPREDELYHLPKLAWISRLMKNESLCEALRCGVNEDAMRVLFMPEQSWIAAA